MNVAAVDADLHAVAGVLEVHDLHVWEVTSEFPALSAHILVDHSHDCHERRQTITALLHERYGLDHTTLQVDHATPSMVPADELSRRLHPKQPEIDDPQSHHSTTESASQPPRPSEPHT